MFRFARFISAAILMVAIGACSPDPARILAEKTGTAASQRKPEKGSRAAAERSAGASRAKAKADAAANPLAFLFRANAEQDFRTAQARSPATVKSTSRTVRAADKAVLPTKAVSARKISKAVKTVRRKPEPSSTQTEARAKGNALAKSTKASRAALTPRTAQQPKPSPDRAHPSTGPTEVVVYDVVAGIKTLHRRNGAVEEEPFDPARLQAIKAARHSGMTRIMIVNEVNPASTGSAASTQHAQGPGAIKAGPR